MTHSCPFGGDLLNVRSEELKELHGLLKSGMCCTSAVVQMGLVLRGEENEQMVTALAGMCNGMQSGLICGALTGGVCMLNLFGENRFEMTRELVDWFNSTYGEKYGGINCLEITGGDRSKKLAICPSLIEATYLQAKNILIEYGQIEQNP